MKELKLKIQNHHTDLTFDSYASQDTVSSHVDAVLQAERRYGDLEKILTSVQAERSVKRVRHSVKVSVRQGSTDGGEGFEEQDGAVSDEGEQVPLCFSEETPEASDAVDDQTRRRQC